MSDTELLESINKKVDALIEEVFRKRNEKYNLKRFLQTVRISRYRLYKLHEDGFLTAFNPVGKRLYCYDDIATVNDALDRYLNSKRAQMYRKEFTDHTGRRFESIKAACDFWHVNYKTFKDRYYRMHYPVEICLQAERLNWTLSADHHGNRYKSIREMCRTYGVSESAFRERFAKGWALKKCLNKNKTYAHDYYDHNGKYFSCMAEMATFWQIPKARLGYRLRHGWSIKKALTTPCRIAKVQE